MSKPLPGLVHGEVMGFATQPYPRRDGARTSGQSILAFALVVIVLQSASFRAQQPTVLADPMQPLQLLIGRWEGTSEGQPGAGTVRRTYSRVLNSKYIQVANQSIYAVQAKNPKGEQHEDLGMFSFDAERGRLVLRQFHVEGFVNQYVSEPGGGGSTLVFTTEAIENIPSGWRARETYTVLGPDAFDEVFELAEPGKEFELYSHARLKRVQ